MIAAKRVYMILYFTVAIWWSAAYADAGEFPWWVLVIGGAATGIAAGIVVPDK